MGLQIHSLEGLSDDHQRDYYIYLLDYGWQEPLGEALRKNFGKFATLASKQENSVLLMRTEDGVEFNDDVLSWHGINGENDPAIFPAVLITNRHPSIFREGSKGKLSLEQQEKLKLILIPLRKYCSTTADVINFIQSIFQQIAEGKGLEKFAITQKKRKGMGKALVDSLIIEPSNDNVSIPLKLLERFLNSGQSTDEVIEKTVRRIHFEDWGGTEFERLVLAYLVNERKLTKIQWLGETGGDGGRDIWGETGSETYCYQCANYQSLTMKKVSEDIDKLVTHNTIPNNLVIVCGGTVSAGTRTKATEYANSTLAGLKSVNVWSGSEFEEMVRRDTPLLIKRFVLGEQFPDTVVGISNLTQILKENSDDGIVRLIADCFDRPAFTTPFNREVNIPDFGKAITDTIEVLNTGMHRLRDGTLIKQIAARHMLKDEQLKNALADITNHVIQLREDYVALIRSKDIRHCDCSEIDCPTYIMTDKACQIMDDARTEILKKLSEIQPAFKPKIRYN